MEFFNVFPLAGLIGLIAITFVKSIALKRNGVITKATTKKSSIEKYLLPTVFTFVIALILFEFIKPVLNFSFAILPTFLSNIIFESNYIKTCGTIFILISLFLMIRTLRDFRNSLRFGLDSKHFGPLVTQGIFSITRNPFFISLEIYFLGVTLIFFNFFFLLITALTIVSIHIFILKEEKFLHQNYGDDYKKYVIKVRRYI